MSDPTVNDMKPYGRASVWTYGENRNFNSWHLCCNRQASAFLIALIDTMLAAKWPAGKKVPLVADTVFTAATACTAAAAVTPAAPFLTNPSTASPDGP